MVWREKYRDRSAASTLVTCWNWHGWLMLLLVGKTTFFCTGFFFFFPGIERLMFSGQETSLSMCCQRSFAAFGLSKLRPARRVWSDERHIVWKAGPDTYETPCPKMFRIIYKLTWQVWTKRFLKNNHLNDKRRFTWLDIILHLEMSLRFASVYLKTNQWYFSELFRYLVVKQNNFLFHLFRTLFFFLTLLWI